MKKIFPCLLLVLASSACRQIAVPALPTADTFAPYHGTPQPASLIVNGEEFNSKVGTSTWTYIDSDGNLVEEHGDAFAILTPTEPILARSPFAFTLILPVPANPVILVCRLFDVTDQVGQPAWYTGRWDYLQNPLEIQTQLRYEQDLTIPLTSGAYVLEVYAGWGRIGQHTELEVDYGFLIEIQE